MSRKDSRGRVLNKGESERISHGKSLGYVYRYRDEAGVQCQIYAKTLADLRKKEKATATDAAHGVKRDGRKLTVQQVAESWLEARRGDVAAGMLRQTTLDSYIYVWSSYFEGSPLARSKVAAVTAARIQEHYKRMLANGLTVGTCETAHVVLAGVMKWANAQCLTATNPARGALTAISKATRTAQRAAGGVVARCLDKESRAYLLEALNGPRFRHYAPIIRLMLHTGLRIGELAGLTREDVAEGVVRVRRCLKYCHDERGHMRLVVNPPKSATSRRDVMLSAAARADLAAFLALGIQCTESVDGVAGFVFCTPKGRPLTYRAVNKILRQLVKESGGALPEGLTCHWLRHTFVCDAIDAGMPVAAVSKYVGHESTEVTMRVYYDCRPHVMAEGLAILDTIDAPASKQTSKQNPAGIREGRVGIRGAA